MLVGDVTREPDYAATPATQTSARSWTCPSSSTGDTWGVLTVQSTQPNAFDEGDASMVRSAAHQLSAGLRAAELRERLERAQPATAEALKAALDAARRPRPWARPRRSCSAARRSAAGWSCPTRA